MGNKILLVQAPPWGIYSPPLGVAYLSTFLKSSGFLVDVLDLNIEMFRQSTEEIKQKWETQDFDFWASGKATGRFYHRLEDFADRIISFNPGIIGFSVTRASAHFLNAVLPIIRQKTRGDAVIVLGGPGTSHVENRPLFRKDLIDYFIVGEGEYSLFCLLRDLQDRREIQTNHDYTVWKDYPEDRVTCLAASIEGSIDINDIPFPDFFEFDSSLYTKSGLISLIGSRGCIRSCAFCCDSPLKKPYRSRNPGKIAEEIMYHVEKYNRKIFEFSDLLINGDLRSLDKLCDILIDADLGIGWGGQATVRPDMGRDIFRKLKKAGCGSLTLGCESFSDRVLKLMHKGTTVRDAKEALVNARDAGLFADVNIIIGFPGEREEDVDETIKFLKDNSELIHNINSLNICNIEPGMHIYEHPEDYSIDRSALNDRHAWFNKDMSNTLEIRLDRHKRLMSVCSGLGLSPLWHNAKR